MAERAASRPRRWPWRRRRIPFVQQTASADCAAACLSMVLGAHGRHVPIDEIRQRAGVGASGADAWSVIEAGRAFGLRGRGVAIDELAELDDVDMPAILHWRFDHFVVLERTTRDGARIIDPAFGPRHITRAELGRSFTGVALLFEPGDDFAPGGRPQRVIGRYLRQLFRRPGLLARLVGMSLFLQLLALALPLATAVIVDTVVPEGARGLLPILGAGLAAIVVSHLLASYLRSLLLLAFRTHLDTRITFDFLDHMIDLPYAFFQRRSAGDLIMRLNSNTMVREILTSGALSAALDGIFVSVYLALLLLADARMGLLVFGLGVLRLLVFAASRTRYRTLMSQALEVQARCRGYQVQMLAGIESTKAMGVDRGVAHHWSNLFIDELNAGLARGRLSAAVDAVLGALAVGSPLLVLIYGASQVIDGALSLGTMLALAALASGFLVPLNALVQTALQMELLGSYVERLADVLDTPREQDPERVRPAPALAGAIALEAVSYRYAPGRPDAVSDVSVDIVPGSFVAIVGTSGAGKSTLAGLLLGMVKPDRGRVRYDGIDLAELELRSVRRQLGIVPQQPYLFGTSIRANLALAQPEIDHETLVEACRRAHIDDEIMALPMGYDSILADGGSSLSGGQRQRLALARALVRRPAILLLDEATSNLDAETEARIHAELAALDATRIVIAHRLSTIRGADVILVMAAGRVVERGRHADLLAAGGAYARLVAAQLGDQAR